ncbi:MAG: ParB/RepB/Spo0J family partition protein [Gammaproteobacteria bacterium]
MKHGLGRGLDELLGASAAPEGGGVRAVAVDTLRPGAGQPRRRFAPEELESLADSIRRRGIIQPILVRPAGGGFEIVAGERRWRAAQMAGLAEVPIIARKLSDREAMLFALVENIQRADLNPAEQARGLARLTAETEMTHAQAAAHLGISRAAVSNLLRLLSLSPPVLQMLEEAKLDGGHARALLSLPAERQLALARRIAAEKLSVRAVEQLTRKQSAARKNAESANSPDGDTRRLESELSARLSARVQIRHRGKGGKLVIHYGSLDALSRLLNRLRK